MLNLDLKSFKEHIALKIHLNKKNKCQLCFEYIFHSKKMNILFYNLYK